MWWNSRYGWGGGERGLLAVPLFSDFLEAEEERLLLFLEWEWGTWPLILRRDGMESNQILGPVSFSVCIKFYEAIVWLL